MSHLRESPSKDEGRRQPRAITALQQLYPALLNSVVSSSTGEIIRIKYSLNSSTFPHPWKSGTRQGSSLAKLPSARPKFRMGHFWNSWSLHLKIMCVLMNCWNWWNKYNMVDYYRHNYGKNLAWAALEWFCIATWKGYWEAIATHAYKWRHKPHPSSARDLAYWIEQFPSLPSLILKMKRQILGDWDPALCLSWIKNKNNKTTTVVHGTEPIGRPCKAIMQQSELYLLGF